MFILLFLVDGFQSTRDRVTEKTAVVDHPEITPYLPKQQQGKVPVDPKLPQTGIDKRQQKQKQPELVPTCKTTKKPAKKPKDLSMHPYLLIGAPGKR